MACSSNSNTPYGLPSNGSPSIDPRATIRNPAGPGVSAPRFAIAQPLTHVHSCASEQSAYFQPEASSSSTQPAAGSSTSAAPSMMQYLDIGTPNYAPAPNLSRIFFSYADADPASPSRGILISDFRSGSLRIEDASGNPLASSYPGMENNIEVEYHVRIDLILRSALDAY